MNLKKRKTITKLIRIALSLFVLFIDVVIFLRFQQVWPLWLCIVWWLPTIVTAFLLIRGKYWFSTRRYTMVMALLLCVAFPKMLFVVCSWVGDLLGHVWPAVADIGIHISAVVAAIAFSITTYGFLWGWKRMKVRRLDLSFAQLPEAFDNYRIVQISDLHLGTLGKDTDFIKRVIARVNDLQPDAIAFTGDLINTSPDEATPFIEHLSRLKAKDGVFSIFGNHDYAPYSKRLPPRREDIKRPLKEPELSMGWHLLLNAHHFIHRGEERIAIVGVENIGRPPFPRIGSLEDAIVGLPDDVFSILLSHDPSHWKREVVPTTDIPLMLSGHTHAGQIKIGRWSPAKWMYKEWTGLYHEGNQYLYVSQGTGARVPVRIGTVAEITLFCLHRCQEK